MKKASGTDSKTTVSCAEFAAIQREMLAQMAADRARVERALAKLMLPVSERGPARAVTNLKPAAEICNCSVEKLRERCERGEIPAEIVDHQWAIDVESHTAWRSKAGRR